MSGNQAKKVFLYGSDFNGLGDVIFNWSQDCQFIAVAGEQKLVYVLDKRGKKLKETEVQSKGKITAIEWDKDSEILCILQEDQSFVWLWNVFGNSSLTQLELENSKTKAAFVKWSKTHPVLVVGSDKGGLLFYNKKNQKKIPTIGKHSKRITSGDWNKEGLLITGGEDKILTVSNYNSDSVQESSQVKMEPTKITWARPKTDQRDQLQRTITAVLGYKSILMYQTDTKKTPLELVFEPRYGKIIDYSLFGDGYIVVAFTEGYVAHISTHIKEIKDEVSSERVFQSTLDAITTNDAVYKMAAAGENQIKIFNLATWKEIKNERIDLPKNAGRVQKLQWSVNGQLLVASTSNGYIFGFLTSIPQLTSTFGSITAVLYSFTEVQIFDTSRQGNSNMVCHVGLTTEPMFITLGPYHLATGISNQVWYYLWLDQSRNGLIKGGDLVQKRDYFGSVKQVLINGYWAAVLADGKCILHPIDPNSAPKDFKEKKFPQSEQERVLYQIALTKEFLIMLDFSGKVKYYHLTDFTYVVEYKPEPTIVKLFNNFSGTRLILQDNKGKCYFFEASSESFRQIQNFPSKVDQILWDQQDHNLFAVLENDNLLSYIINKNNIYGTKINPVYELLSVENLNSQKTNPVVTVLDRGVKPLGMINGFLKCFTPNATIQGQYLTSHSFLSSYKWEDDEKEGHYRYFLQNISLNNFANALFAATQMGNIKLYEALGRKALEFVELEVALKSFQLSKNLAMVMTIQSFAQENEKNLIFGNVAMILGSYDLAQEFFLKSTQPIHALEMRSDIQDFLIALNLAKTIAPHMEPYICKRLAQQIESQGNDSEAKNLYEKAILSESNKPSEKQKIDSHNMQCWAGISRTCIKSGDIQRGISIAKTITDKNVVIEIAVVCENMKQLIEAAELYENAGMLEKAATLYIQLKDFKRASPLMSLIKSNKLLSLYAKSKETEGGFQEAEKYYEKAEDWENVIRLNLSPQIDNFEKAKLVVRNKCPTSTCASMVAQVCDKQGYKEEAVEFLVIAGKKEEAFIIAQSAQCMEIFEQTLKEQKSGKIELTVDDALKIAAYYEAKGEWLRAAENYEKANNPNKALKLYMKVGEEVIPQMIELVKNNKQQQSLIQNITDYLSGELGDGPKDPKHLLDLQSAIGNVKALTNISLTIAQDAMERADYKEAHQTLFNTYQKLKEEKVAVQYDLEQKLMIIHSYQIVKRVVKTDDHDNAAWLLHRVSSNISSFQQSKINIFTSTVIESIRANNKPLAYKWSVELVRPENRGHINEKYKGKIEKIAIRPVRDPIVENKTECPFCQNLVPEFKLDCDQCQNQIPFCIASGKHIIAQELVFCPSCTFPANIKYFKRLLQNDKQCPMCDNVVDPSDLVEAGESGVQKLKQIRQGQPQ